MKKKVSVFLIIIMLGAIGLYQWFLPQVFHLSGGSIRSYKKAGIPENLINPLKDIEGKRFQQKELLQAMESRVGTKAFHQYEEILWKYVRKNRNCWPNTHSQSVYEIQGSEGHPLFGILTYEPLIPFSEMPPLPTQFVFLPEDQGLLVMSKYGHIVHFNSNYEEKFRLKIPEVYEGPEDQGALGLALDLAFQENQFLYIAYVNLAGNQNVVQRLQWKGDKQTIIKSLVDVLRVPKHKNKFHGIGAIHFNSKGVLLIPIGDPVSFGQDRRSEQGKLLGILPKHDAEGGYKVPDWGVWHQLKAWVTGPPIVLASGLRSPWTATLWKDTLFIGDVGGDGPYSYEEINYFYTPEMNFGWGACVDPQLHGDFVPPVLAYRRNDTASFKDVPNGSKAGHRSVWVGVVYDNFSIDRYQGKLKQFLIYGDFYLGFVRGAKLNQQGQVIDDVFLMHLPYLTNLRIGRDGYIYALAATGEQGLYRLRLMDKKAHGEN